MDGHYIQIDTANEVIDLTDTLIRLLRPTTARASERSFPMLVLPDGAEVFVNELGDGLAELAISHPHPTERRPSAQRVHDTLFEQTPWALRWTADDTQVVILTGPAQPGHSPTSPRHRLLPRAG